MNHKPCHRRQLSLTRKRPQVFAAVLLLMTMLAAACGSGFDRAESQSDTASGVAYAADDADSSETSSGDYDEDFAPTAEETANESRQSDGGIQPLAGLTVTGAAGGDDVIAQLPDFGRDIIYTATLDVASTDVSTATRNAIRAIEARGGFLFSQDTQGGAYGSSTLTFKVLPDQFHAALNDLGSVGTVRSQSISADDVSAVVVDLESRINTAEASVIRLRNLLEGATELETIATLENQLLQRETTLEQLRGQLRSVRNQVDLATITLFVSELTNRPSLAIEAFSYAGHDAGFGCFDSQSVRSGEVADPITICYRLVNTGDAPLVDLAIDDPSLNATIGSLVVVDGSATQLEPGESVLLAHEIELTEPVRVRTSATATGLDADGNPLDQQIRATAATMRFDVTDFEAGFPSFGEVLGNSWNALVTAAIVIALIAVAVAPFAAVALVIAVPLWFWLRRIRAARPAAPTYPAPTYPAPTPPSPPATVAASTDGDADNTTATAATKTA